MSKNILLRIAITFVGSLVFMGSGIAFQELTKSQVDDYVDDGFILSESNSSLRDCDTKRVLYNKDYPNFLRSVCFKYSGYYHYFICNVGSSCELSGNTNEVSDTVSETTTTDDVPYKAKLDIMINKLVTWINSQDDKTVALKTITTKLDKLKTKYNKNSTVLAMISYLRSGITARVEDDSVDNFWCDFAGECDSNTEVVVPVCGSANGKIYDSQPKTELCSIGSASQVSGNGPWVWSCTQDGVSLNCSAKKSSTTDVVVNGVCGSSNDQTVESIPTSGLCLIGKASSVSGKGPWVWTCEGSGGGINVDCTAYSKDDNNFTELELYINNLYKKIIKRDADATGLSYWVKNVQSGDMLKSSLELAITCAALGVAGVDGDNAKARANDHNLSCGSPEKINGVCGPMHGTFILNLPKVDLCKEGIAGVVNGENGGPWSWTCAGEDGGNSASCSTIKLTAEYLNRKIDGVCGNAQGNTHYGRPWNNLCKSGTATEGNRNEVLFNSPRKWECTGSNGGITASCSITHSELMNVKVIEDGACSTKAVRGGVYIFYERPTTNTTGLCDSGKVGRVGGSGPWTWTCESTSGGTTAYCQSGDKFDGKCGKSNGVADSPRYLDCEIGSQAPPFGTGPWYRYCKGGNGGQDALCRTK